MSHHPEVKEIEVGGRSDCHGSNAAYNEGEVKEGRQLKYVSLLTRELGKGHSSGPPFPSSIKEGEW